MTPPPLVLQTTYAELVDRCASAAFGEAFPADGAFTPKKIKDRTYWYFQQPTDQGRQQKYVGPETPELLARIARHKEARDDERERASLVSTLIRSLGLPRPITEVGDIIEALAKAGVFRLHGVLVGTAAYQTYPAMLGVRLPAAALQTGDIDIAQFEYISVAVEDHTQPVLDVLKEVDETFRSIPHTTDSRRVARYEAKSGLRVEFLTPNEGPDTDVPQSLPTFGTDAQPLRFLDFLIREPESTVVLHKAGVYVQVPAPQRYAIHKLIISRRRREGTGKRDKDIQQAESLLDVLVQKRPYELRSAWREAYDAGRKWRLLLSEGMLQLSSRLRDVILKTVDARRKALPGFDLTFNNPPARYDFDRDVVTFSGEAANNSVQCAISREALDDHFGTDGFTKEQRVEKFLENRSAIERMARDKYLNWPIEAPDAVLIKTEDVPQLRPA